MSKELACPHPDCGETVLIDWHLAYAVNLDDLPRSEAPNHHGVTLTPADSQAQTWSIGCMAGHVLLTPGPLGCCEDSDCGHDRESYDWFEECREFRDHDWDRLVAVLTAVGSISRRDES